MEEKYCEMCGKPIFPTPMWVYKIKHQQKGCDYFCSYTCWEKGKSEFYKKERKNRKTFRWRNGE